MRSAYGNWEMPSEDPANFPDLPAFAEEKYHQLKAADLRVMIRRTVFAAASDIGRYSMTGVLWELEDDKARLVATDGRRLALMEGPATAVGGHTTKGQTPIVPSKAMTLLERNLQDDEEQARVGFRPNEVLFRTERAMVYSRLVEGRFPDWRKAMPQKHTARVPLTTGPFLSAVRQAAIMTDEESKRVRFQFAKGKLTLRAQGAEAGQSRVELPVEYTGKNLEISFDPKFVTDMLRVLEPDTPLVLDMNDSASPAVFRHEPNYLYVIVPLVETK